MRFLSFAEPLEIFTPERLEEYFLKRRKLEPQFSNLNLDENTRKLLYACWVATRATRKLLDDVASPGKRNYSLINIKQ